MYTQRRHLDKRSSGYGQWLPVVLYLITLALSVMEIAYRGAWHLLWLIVFPLLPLALYLWRIQRSAGWHRTLP
jgi:hypothetical protein